MNLKFQIIFIIIFLLAFFSAMEITKENFRNHNKVIELACDS